jgi:hypothetical protein
MAKENQREKYPRKERVFSRFAERGYMIDWKRF